MNLLSQYYKHSNYKRQKEIDDCLQHNCDNHLIKHIYLFDDMAKYQIRYDHPKIIYIPLNTRLKYQHCIEFANTHLINQICIISNIDIYFNHTLQYINIEHNHVLALTRHDIIDNKLIFKQNADSQDTWIFKSPLHINTDVPLGVPGCDNRFAYDIIQAGCKINNPSTQIQCIHKHHIKNGYSITAIIPPPYKYVPIE